MTIHYTPRTASQMAKVCRKHGKVATVEVQSDGKVHLAVIDYSGEQEPGKEGKLIRHDSIEQTLEFLGY